MDLNEKKQSLKIFTRSAYDIQFFRLQMALRIAANLRKKLKLDSTKDSPERTAILKHLGIEDSSDKTLLSLMKKDYRSLKEFTKELERKDAMTSAQILSDETEYYLAEQYIDVEAVEKKHFRKLEKLIEEFPIWTEYLRHVRGVGPAMAGVIISEIDIHKAKYHTSLVRLCGLDSLEIDGKMVGRGKKEGHLIDKEYTKKDGTIGIKKSITYNPFLKAKLVGVLGELFIKLKSPFAEVYYNSKTRYENHVVYSQTTKMHRHRMAIRYMIKIFLHDLYNNWRKLEGLEVHVPYAVAKLGRPAHEKPEILDRKWGEDDRHRDANSLLVSELLEEISEPQT